MGWCHVNWEGIGYCLGSEYDLELNMEGWARRGPGIGEKPTLSIAIRQRS